MMKFIHIFVKPKNAYWGSYLFWQKLTKNSIIYNNE